MIFMVVIINGTAFSNDLQGMISLNNDSFEETNSTLASVSLDNQRSHAMDTEKWTIGVALDPIWFFLWWGPTASVEFTKGKFNAQIYALFSPLVLLSFYFEWPENSYGDFLWDQNRSGGGIGLAFNYFHHTRIGGFYVGGMFECLFAEMYYANSSNRQAFPFYNYLGLALNIGYKFITRSGIYFRTGVHIGGGIIVPNMRKEDMFYYTIRPDLSLGYNFKKRTG